MLHALIIEDEPMVAMMIEDVLLENGVTSTAVASTQQDAVAMAGERRPDFITSDVTLLEGTGPAAVADILRLHGHIPVLFITATPDACSPATPEAVLMKPFTPHGIARRFHQLIG
jgi:CheY-like chemotaxis protein